MKEAIIRGAEVEESFLPEGCFIKELWNTPEDSDVSIARARVAPGVTTALHRVRDTCERYLVAEGQGRVEVGDLPPRMVGAGDVVIIPPGVSQRITNMGNDDLLFYCICSPRFVPAAYETLETER